MLEDQPGLRWVQLPFAGVENAVAAGVIDPGRTWTSAKGLYAQPVAEHALMLALAGLRVLPERIRAHSWGTPAGTSLYGAPVTILGGGGITEELLRLLAPFGVEATVVRRQAEPVPGAARTVTTAELDDVLPGALVVFLALALTPATERHHRRRPSSRPWTSGPGWSTWPAAGTSTPTPWWPPCGPVRSPAPAWT